MRVIFGRSVVGRVLAGTSNSEEDVVFVCDFDGGVTVRIILKRDDEVDVAIHEGFAANRLGIRRRDRFGFDLDVIDIGEIAHHVIHVGLDGVVDGARNKQSGF